MVPTRFLPDKSPSLNWGSANFSVRGQTANIIDVEAVQVLSSVSEFTYLFTYLFILVF